MSGNRGGRGLGGVFWVSLGILVGLVGWRLLGPVLERRSLAATRCPPGQAGSASAAVAGADSSGGGAFPAGLPGVDLGGLTDRERFTVLHRAAAEACTCGCGEKIAVCRRTDPDCKTSLGLARAIRADVRRG